MSTKPGACAHTASLACRLGLEYVMIIIFGLVILVAAVIIGVVGVVANGGSGHGLTHGFAAFGYHVTGSTGTLFLYGIVVGAVAVAGLSVLLAGARRTSRRGRAARRGLRQSRSETAAVSQERDDLIGQREAARTYPASVPGNGTARGDSYPGPDDRRGEGWRRLFGRRADPRQEAPAESPEPVADQRAPDAPADAPGTAAQLTDGSRP
jgi:hypothetical protein